MQITMLHYCSYTTQSCCPVTMATLHWKRNKSVRPGYTTFKNHRPAIGCWFGEIHLSSGLCEVLLVFQGSCSALFVAASYVCGFFLVLGPCFVMYCPASQEWQWHHVLFTKLCINHIRTSDILICVGSSEVYTLVFYLKIIAKY